MSLNEAVFRIKETVNIVDFISEYVALKKVGRNYVGLCPFHSESKPSFTVNEEKQIFRCFGCGAGGDVIGFYMRIAGLSFVEAVKELARRFNIPIKETPYDSEIDEKRKALYRINEKAARFFRHFLETSPEAERARAYLKERGLSGETAKIFLLGYAPEGGGILASHLRLSGVELPLAEEAGVVIRREDGSFYDRFRGRLIFPIRDVSGRVVAFGGRILADGEPKYLNSPETPVYHKSRILYGCYESRTYIRQKDSGFLVEGYFDLLTLWDRGIRNVVASCGTALTREHVKLLRRLSRNWYLVFDADPAGERAAVKALGLFFQENLFPKVVFLPSGEDPDSLVRNFGPEAFFREVERAKEALPFLLEYLLREYGTSPQGKSAVVKELREILSGIPDPVIRYEYFRISAERLGLPVPLLLSESRRETSSPKGTSSTGTPFERALLQFLIHFPSFAAELRALRAEEFLKTPAFRALFENIMKALEDNLPLETLSFSDVDLQALFSELLFSPPPDEPPEEVWAQIKSRLLRERFNQEKTDILSAIREAESSGQKENLLRLLQEYRNLCLQNLLKCRGEGEYESVQK